MILRKPVSKECVVTLRFGKYPLWLYEMFGLMWHDGIDFAPLKKFKKNTQIITAAAGGLILNTGYDRKAGIYLTQDHWAGQQAVLIDYFHLKKVIATQGQRIKAGAEIAIMGKTGNATDDHLHFRCRKWVKGKWKVFDPAPYFVE